MTTAKQPTSTLHDGTGSRLMSLTPAPRGIRMIELRASEKDEWQAIPASDFTLRGGRLTFVENPSGMFSAWPKGKATVRVTP